MALFSTNKDGKIIRISIRFEFELMSVYLVPADKMVLVKNKEKQCPL